MITIILIALAGCQTLTGYFVVRLIKEIERLKSHYHVDQSNA